MIRATITVRKLAARKNPGLADLAELFRDVAKALFDPYRPELHYMRGPGVWPGDIADRCSGT